MTWLSDSWGMATALGLLLLSTLAWALSPILKNVRVLTLLPAEEDPDRPPVPLASESGAMGVVPVIIQQRPQAVIEALDGLSMGVALLSGDLHVLSANQSFRGLVNLTPEELCGKALESALPAMLSQKGWSTSLQNAKRDGANVVSFVGDHSGKRLRITLKELPSGNADDGLRVVLVEDMTELTRARAAAEEVSEVYQQILSATSEAFVLAGADTRLIDANQAALTLLGYARDEVAGRPLGEMLDGGLAEHVWDGRLAADACRLEGMVVQSNLRRRDGSVFPAEAKLNACGGERGRFFMVSLRDATGDRLADLLGRERLQVVQMIAQYQPMEAVLTSLTQMIEHQVPESFCAVMLVKGERLVTAVAPNLPRALYQILDKTQIGPGGTSCGIAALERRAVTIADITSVSPALWYREAAAACGVRACWSVPVFSSEGVVVGTLALYRREPGNPSAAEMELLETGSRLASVCIEQRQLTDQLAYRARHDSLTGLPNRLDFEEGLKRALARARRYRQRLGILSVDLDRFKLVNDTLAHAAGDCLLRKTAQRMQSCLRETDFIARWGGDEFVAGLVEIKDRQDAILVADKLVDAFRTPFDVEGHEIPVTASIGISVYPEDGEDVDELIRNADHAMYGAKGSGRNGALSYTRDLGEVDRQRLYMENQLGGALARSELALNYQPQFDLKTGKIVGLEALLRWRHPQLGAVPPSSFIPVAEDSGLIVQLGTWALQTACRQARRLQSSSSLPIRMAVNVSSLQFARTDFVDVVARTIDEAGIEASLLELELTESLLMKNMNESASRLSRLKKLGVHLSLDDFGTGYSSLSYLQRLPIDSLKIDQSFVHDLGNSSKSPLLVESIATLARSLGMLAVAEGVESSGQLSAVQTAGCDVVQGFLLGRPVLAEDLFPVPGLPTAGHPGFRVVMPARRSIGTPVRNGCRPLPYSIGGRVSTLDARLGIVEN